MKKQLLGLICTVMSISSFAAGFDAEIKARQDAYSLIGDNVKLVGKMVKSGDIDWAKLEMYAEQLASSSSKLPTLFPQGSQEGSDARAAVWEKPDKFKAGLEKLDGGFQSLYAAAKAQDLTAAVAGFEQATSTCKGCHRSYRVKR